MEKSLKYMAWMNNFKLNEFLSSDNLLHLTRYTKNNT